MPQINLIPEVLYEPNQPYHYLYDNIPLKNILARISLVNIQTDKTVDSLRGTAGSAGSLAARLDASLEDNGHLKSGSVDSSLHNIAYHEDGEKDGVEYVRMLAEERAKLSQISSEANVLTLQVDGWPALTDGNVEFRSSPSVMFEMQAPNIIKAHSTLPPDVAHRHEYGLSPAQSSLSNWKDFKTTSLSTPYMEGSLRVYINGIRTSAGSYVPIFSGAGGSPTWSLFYVASENASEGTFSLNSPLLYPAYNKIVIDFDTLFPATSSSSSS